MSVDLSTALDQINSADEAIKGNEGLFRNVSQTIIAGIVVVGWAIVIGAIMVWTWQNGKGSSEFICNTPPSSGSGQGTDCTNGWVATRDQFKDVFTFAVLPFVTLVIGFYFGQKSGSEGDG